MLSNSVKDTNNPPSSQQNTNAKRLTPVVNKGLIIKQQPPGNSCIRTRKIDSDPTPASVSSSSSINGDGIHVAQIPPAKKGKTLSRDQRTKKKEPPTPSMRFVEYVAMGGAFMSTVCKITSMCVGETTEGVRVSLDPMKSLRTEFEDIITHLEHEDNENLW